MAIFLTGCTASGKTSLALAVAEACGGEENYSLADYLRDAATAEDAAFRREMQMLVEREPPGTLHRRLADVDPLTAARLHPNDTRRIIRALEVFTQTGVPLTSQQTHFNKPQRHEPVFVLARSPQRITDRIAERTRLLLDHGWLDEARTLRKSADTTGRPLSRTALQAVGYRELFAVLDGTMTLDDATARIIIRTRQLAKRQRTWFRSLARTSILDAETMTQEAMIAVIVAHAAGHHCDTIDTSAKGVILESRL